MNPGHSGNLRFADALGLLAVALLLWPWLPVSGDVDYPLLVVTASLLLPVACGLLGGYRPGRGLLAVSAAFTLGWIVSVTLLGLLLLHTRSVEPDAWRWMGLVALGGLAGGMVLRAALHRLPLGRSGAPRRVLLIASASCATQIERRLAELPRPAYRITQRQVGRPEPGFIAAAQRLARQSIFQRDFDEVWIGYPLTEGPAVSRLARAFLAVPVNLRYLPDLADLTPRCSPSPAAASPALNLNLSPLRGPSRLAKALEDRLLGLVLFLAFLPLMLCIAALIRWRMGQPVLFKQYRHGLDGKPIRIYKFRTLREDTRHPPVGSPSARRLGAFLHRTSLDELPQLFNVLQGRMSLVGPRPHAMDQNDHFKDLIDAYMLRHRVKPGMTGWAQVNGLRGMTMSLHEMQRRVDYDLHYIQHWSLGLDLKILALTAIRGMFSGASRGDTLA